MSIRTITVGLEFRAPPLRLPGRVRTTPTQSEFERMLNEVAAASNMSRQDLDIIKPIKQHPLTSESPDPTP